MGELRTEEVAMALGSTTELVRLLNSAEKAIEAGDESRAVDVLERLIAVEVNKEVLKKSAAGIKLKSLRKMEGAPERVVHKVKEVCDVWKKKVVAELARNKTANAAAKGAVGGTEAQATALKAIYRETNAMSFRQAMSSALVGGLCRSESEYKVGDVIRVHDRMQKGYSYKLSASIGADFDPGFLPVYSPREMLELGVFEGKYLNDCLFEFPKEWYEGALKKRKLSRRPDVRVNCTQTKSRQPLSTWNQNGWLRECDPRGWFQWYCRYYLGRRMKAEDARQIGRWRSFGPRHSGQIKANCAIGDISCRPRQRQGLLQWSYPYDI